MGLLNGATYVNTNSPQEVRTYTPAAAQGAAPAEQGGATTQVAGESGPSGARVANARMGGVWNDVASGSSYQALFGDQSYVKDGSDPQLLSMLQSALSKAPELQSTALAQHVAQGKVGKEDIEILQNFLESKGYSVGAPGVDGKYGPLTHDALDRFLNGLPPGGQQTQGRPGQQTQGRPGQQAPGQGAHDARGDQRRREVAEPETVLV